MAIVSAVVGSPAAYAENSIAAAQGVKVQQTGAFSDAVSKKLKVPSDLDPIFEEAAQKYQIPSALLKAVGKAESDFNPSAVSKAGAQGVMQLMPGTAKYLGVTDPFDPRQNIMGGAKYLREMLDKYDGNAKLALAAYNAGSNNVDKYGGIPPFKETQNYVVKVMGYAGSQAETVPSKTAGKQLTIGGSSYSGNLTSVSGANPYSSMSTYSTQAAPYKAADSATLYQTLLQSIFGFDGFSSDDYLLFLEMLKNSLQSPGVDPTSLATSDNAYQSMILGGRFQTLY